MPRTAVTTVLSLAAGCASVSSALAQGGDDATTATPVPGIPFVDTGDTTGLTDQFDAVCPFSGSTSPDAWYSYQTGPSLESIGIRLCESGFDTKTYVLDEAFNVVGCNDDACSSAGGLAFRSFLQVTLPANGLYYIVVDGWSGALGTYELELAAGPVACDLTCPPGGTAEGERCDDSGTAPDPNAGCNVPDGDPLLQTIECGSPVCGIAWALDGTRDTDWYELAASDQDRVITATLTTEFPAAFFASDATLDCGAPTVGIDFVERCSPFSGERVVFAGQRPWLFVASSKFDGLPCDIGGPFIGNDYVLSVECQDFMVPCPELGDTDADGDVDFQDLLTLLANFGPCP